MSFPKRSIRSRSIAPIIALSTFALFGCSEESATPLAPRTDAPQFSVARTGLASTGWQAQARTLVAANTLSPMAAGRAYALLAVTQFAALNDVDEQGYSDSTLPDDGYGAGGRARFESERGAVAGASAAVLSFLFPSAATSLQQRVDDEGSAGPGQTHPAFERGVEVGQARATRMIARARADHFTDVWTGTVPTGPGMWINNGPPALPLLGTVTPYVMTSGSQFRSPPPAFNSPAFLTDLNEIKTLSAGRTAQQLAIAVFWNMPPGTQTPLGYWNQLATGLINENQYDERAATHLFAVLNAAMFDALIGCWDAKYFYWVIRPSQAASPGEITLPIGLPNHPSYPSGHSCGSSAAVTVLGHYFPTHASELNAQMVEAGLSRMYAGIHYRFDITAGQNLGRSVAQAAISLDQTRGILANIQ